MDKVSSSNSVASSNNTEKPHLEEVEEMKCPICNSSKVSRCSGCNKIAYCSRQHQKQDWKVHKSSCSAWKVFESKELGRYLIATRDIKPGEIVMEEKPLFIIPPRNTPPLCLGCHIEFEDVEMNKGSSGSSVSDAEKSGNFLAKPVPCPKNCGWPLCGSSQCMASEYHEAECEAALARGGVKVRNYEQEHPTYEAIGILRILYQKTKNPEVYDKILKLKSSYSKSDSGSKDVKGKGSSYQREDFLAEKRKCDMRIVNLIRDFFHVSNTSKDEILHLLGILETNGHEIPASASAGGHINRHFIGVFYNASFFEHNCISNCVKTFPSSQDIVIRATGLIKRGDHLSISYVDPLWGSFDRVNFLEMSKNFTCKCSRCLDPTELGTHISSLRCQKIVCLNRYESGTGGMDGLIIPEEPFNPEGNWKCITCGEGYPGAYVSSIVENAGKELDSLHQSYGNIEAEEEFIKKYSKMLSPNHFYLLEIKLELAQIYGRLKDQPLPLLPPKKLARKRQLCEELLKVFNVISPGWNRLRAIILYELQATISTVSKLKRALEEISGEMHKQELLLCIAWIREAIQIFSWEPEHSVERRRGEGALGELMEMQELVMSLS